MSETTQTQPPKGSLWHTVKVVGWSFLGVRKNSEFQTDIARLTPYQVIGVGLVAGILFVLILIGIVNWIVR